MNDLHIEVMSQKIHTVFFVDRVVERSRAQTLSDGGPRSRRQESRLRAFGKACMCNPLSVERLVDADGVMGQYQHSDFIVLKLPALSHEKKKKPGFFMRTANNRKGWEDGKIEHTKGRATAQIERSRKNPLIIIVLIIDK